MTKFFLASYFQNRDTSLCIPESSERTGKRIFHVSFELMPGFSSKHIWDYRDNSEPVRCHETIPHKNAIFGAHLLCPRNMSWCRRSTCFWAGRHIYLERTNNSLPLLHTNLNSLFVRIWDHSISVSPSMVDPSPFQRTQLALVQDKWKCWERVEKSFSFRNWNYPTFFKKIRNLALHELTLTL